MIQALKSLWLPIPRIHCDLTAIFHLINMVWRWFEDGGAFTITIRKFKSSFLSLHLVLPDRHWLCQAAGLALHTPHCTALPAHSLHTTVSPQALSNAFTLGLPSRHEKFLQSLARPLDKEGEQQHTAKHHQRKPRCKQWAQNNKVTLLSGSKHDAEAVLLKQNT